MHSVRARRLLKVLVGMIAFFIGIAVSFHTILDCVELKLSCHI